MFDVSYRPSGILAAGSELWAEDHAATNAVYAIDPETGQANVKIGIPRPCDLAASDDRIWVADLDEGRLISIDATTHEFRDEVTGLEGPCGPQAADGAILLAVDEGLARVDPTTTEVVVLDLDGAAFPGSGVPMWAARFDSGDLIRIDPATGAAQPPVRHPAGRTEGPAIASGFDSLWVGGSADTVYRLDPETGEVQTSISTSQATRLLVTDESIWLTSYPEGVVERIDPERNEVVFRARLGGNLNGITEGFGGVWVADTAGGIFYRLDPGATGVTP
jgi:streptogramin lyase